MPDNRPRQVDTIKREVETRIIRAQLWPGRLIVIVPILGQFDRHGHGSQSFLNLPSLKPGRGRQIARRLFAAMGVTVIALTANILQLAVRPGLPLTPKI